MRTIDLPMFRVLLADGRLERCITPHEGGFESYLRLSRLSCVSFVSTIRGNMDSRSLAGGGAPASSLSSLRFLGFHLYDHEVGTRDKHYEYTRIAPHIVMHAQAFAAALFGDATYFAAHVRVADAHWEHSDCEHTLDGALVHSVSCGEIAHVINHTSIARELLFAMGDSGAIPADDETGSNTAVGGDILHVAAAVSNTTGARPVPVFLATNFACADHRVAEMAALLRARGVEIVCAQEQLWQRTGLDNFIASLVEQEVCARAYGFVGSRYSTWTDTVNGLRAQPSARRATFSFEELWARGVR